MKRNPLIRFVPARLALLIAPLLAAWPQQSRAGNAAYNGGTGGTWHTITNWTPNTGFPGDSASNAAGEGLATDVASAVAANAATNFGINMNTLGGQLTLGAIDWNKTNTSATTIGNISTTSSGILQLNGSALGVANTVVRLAGSANLTLSNVNAGSAAVTMGVRLGNTAGVFDVGASRTLQINSIVSEAVAGSSITKTGPGTLNLAGANTFTGGATVNDGVLQLRHSSAGGEAGSLLVTNGGAPGSTDNNSLQLSGGITITQPITLENLGTANSRVIMESANTVNANANTVESDITVRGGVNTGIIAGSAPLNLNGDILMDALTATNVLIRGSNSGTINGNILLPQTTVFFKTDPGTWTINSTGNTMGNIGCADGLVVINNNDALEPDSVITMGQGSATTGRLQINAGFTQQITGLGTPITGTLSTAPNGHTVNGPGALDVGAINRIFSLGDSTVTTTELTVNAPINGSGGFTKTEAGNLIVNSTVAGPVTVAGGGLAGSGTLAGGLTILSGGGVNGGLPLAAGTLNTSSVIINSGGSLTVNLGSGGSDLIANTGSLAAAAGSLISVVPNGSFTAGDKFPVVSYTGASPGTVPFSVVGYSGLLGSRATVQPYDDGTNIGVEVLTADKVIWTGTAGPTWDAGTTSSWKLESNSAADFFQLGDATVFDDSGTNTAITLVNPAVPPALLPVRMEFRNTSTVPYTLTGAGSLSGPAVLDKTGDGTLTMDTNNTYTGATSVGSGLLIANQNIAAGSATITPIPAASPVHVTGSGTVRFVGNNSTATIAAVNVPHTISGNGTVEHNARIVAGVTNALASTFTGNNASFTGTLRLLSPNGGTQRLTQVNASAVGGATIEVQSGHQFYTAANQTFNNAITISGTGYQDANGFIGALRLDPGAIWAGPVTIAAGGARIGSHNTSITTAGVVSGDISGGPLEVNVSNYGNNYTLVFTGNNSYTTTTVGGVGGVAPQTGASVSMRLNIGGGGTAGTLGSGAVTVVGDAGATNGTNGVLGFDRSDGYTLGAGNTITGAGSSLPRVFVDLDCTGTGFENNSVGIDLGTPGGAAGNLRAGISRANTVSTLTGSVETGAFIIGSHNTAAASTGASVRLRSGATVSATSVTLATGGSTAPNGNTAGAQLMVDSGASLSATSQIFLGEGVGSGATVTQNGDVTAVTQVRAGHWGSELSTWNMMGGTLMVTGASSQNTPSTSGAGSTTATGDNNIDITNPATLVGGGIYLGIDGTGVLNHTGGTVSTNWIVLDNRADSTGGGDGIDRYNISGGAVLRLRSEWGLIARNVSTDVSLGGGTIQLDNTGTGGPAGNTGPDLDVPLNAILNTVALTTTTLDTNGTDNSFLISRDVTGTGLLDLTGGGTIQLGNATTQNISAELAGSTALLKSGTGTTVLTGGSSSYSGTTTVSAGILRLDAALGGSVIVQTGGTLAGTGPAGPVVVEDGGVVSPGASVGTLGASSVNLQTGARYDAEITAAATADKLSITGALTANGTVKVTLSGYVPVPGDSFDVADAATIAGAPVFDFSAAVLTAGLAWDTSAFLTSGVISVISGDPFNAWAAGYGLTEGKNGDDDDDGSSNLLEFATDAVPNSGSSSPRAFGKVHILGGDNVLTLTIAVRKNAVFAAAGSTQQATKDSVIYTVEASDDLLVWNSVVVTELNPADSAAVQASLGLPALDADWEWHTFRTDGNTLLDPRDMIRLSVAAQP